MLRFQLVSRGPPGSWHAEVSARAILAYFQVAASNREDCEEIQPRSVTEDIAAHGGEFSRWLDRSAHIGRLRVKCVKIWK